MAESLSISTREELLKLVLRQKIPVAQACREFGVSRYTFYKWLKRYKAGEGLKDRLRKVKKFWRQATSEQEKLVLKIVVESPTLSKYKIAERLRQITGQPILGSHGVYNVLRRWNLTLPEARLAYAKKMAAAIQPVTWINRMKLVWETFVPTIAPAPPPLRFLKPFLVSLASSSILSLIFLLWLSILSGQPTSVKLGLFFATIALLVGTIFFLYSMKYYFTLALVLSFSRRPQEEEGGLTIGLNGRFNGNHKNGPSASFGSAQDKGSGWLKRIFGLVNGPSTSSGLNSYEIIRTPGLEPSLEHIKLKREPFVSIHLPFYNEKQVANRILAACTSFDYPNFEVIVCDDSTDETAQILKDWEKHPKVKILHRLTREGFKGGALKYALQAMDPKTEFVLVFDADFVPYPDTLTQFLKYFKATGGWSEEQNYQAEKVVTMPYETFLKTEISSQEQGALDHQLSALRQKSNTAVVAGYQWHVLNKSENWITRGVRTEYAGSYVIERPGQEILGALKIIHGSVYCIRADVLKHFGWGTSITEDFELTLRIYEKGFKVVYTPYIQAPSECVSTIKRLVRQRMRWAEGHSFNVKKMFLKLLMSPKLTLAEKAEFLYISPYYLQAFFFLLGTFSWLLAETVFQARLPFWTSLWGWSLVLTNFFALPLMNAVGLFLEESEEKDYLGLLSFIVLSYLLVPFQAYAAVKGFVEPREGPWFRTPKTGKITDIFTRDKFYRWISGIIPGRRVAPASARMSADISANPYVALATANNQFENFRINPRKIKWLGRAFLAILLLFSTTILSLAPAAPYFIKPQETQAKAFGTIAGKELALEKTQLSVEVGNKGLEEERSPAVKYREEFAALKEGEERELIQERSETSKTFIKKIKGKQN
ncbi:MAG: glycosyltransferase, partial [bacterium]|nr:glycosyltransferase [bacterium]